MDINQIRQQYPQYSDLSDEQLALGLHQKFYADMPQDEFLGKIGFSKTDVAGAKFDVTAGKGLKGLGNVAGAALEVGEHMATGVAGDIVGAATSAITQNPKKGEAYREKVSALGAPSTPSGKAAEEYVGALMEPVSKVMNKPVEYLEKKGHPILAQATRAVEDVVPIGVPKALRGARAVARPAAEAIAGAGEAKAVAKAAEAAPKNELIADVRKLGLKLTSQDIGAPVGKRVEALASRPQLEREISLGNAAGAKKAAAADVDIKEPLTAGSVQKAIGETLTSYKAPRQLGRVNLAADKDWQSTLQQVEGSTAQEKADFPEDFNEKVSKEIAKFNKPSADADTLITKIAKLRERASDNFRGNAEDKALARAQRSLADGMEEAIERHAQTTGKGGVMKQFRADRTKLAKLYTIRDALTESGELDLGELEARLNKGEPLTGNLRTLARAKSAFDRSFQNPDNIRGHPVGALDIGLGVLAGGAKGFAAGHVPGGAVGLMAAAARPATRAVLKSGAYQAARIKPRIPKPSAVSRMARRVAGPKGQHRIQDLPKKRIEPTLSDE